MKPLVSILTPTYNHSAYIGACIRSVRAQSYAHWELIIVDDGSSDDTLAIARKAAEGDPRIRLVEQNNVGVFHLAATYNRALELARGELVAVLEGDDLWDPQKLERQVQALHLQSDAILCYSDIRKVGEDGRTMQHTGSEEADIPHSEANNDPPGSILNQLYLNNCIAAVSVVVRRSALDDIGGFRQPEGLPLVDLPTWIELATRGPFAYVPETLASWRWHPFQVTKSYHTEILRHVHDLVREHSRNLAEPISQAVYVGEDRINSHHSRALHRSYAQSGRYKLVQRRFAEARADFSRAIFFPSGGQFLVRLAAVAGLLSGLLKADMEWAARLAGKAEIS